MPSSSRDWLPDLATAEAEHVTVCVHEYVGSAYLEAVKALQESADFRARRPVFVHAGYVQEGGRHEAGVWLLPLKGRRWHVQVNLRLVRKFRRDRSQLVVESDGGAEAVNPVRVSGGKVGALLRQIGECVAGKSIELHGTAHFRLAAARYRPVVQVPAPLVEPPEVSVPVDILGVRLAWRDGSRSMVIDVGEVATNDFTVFLNMRGAVEVGAKWLHDVLGHLRTCLADITEPAVPEG